MLYKHSELNILVKNKLSKLISYHNLFQLFSYTKDIKFYFYGNKTFYIEIDKTINGYKTNYKVFLKDANGNEIPLFTIHSSNQNEDSLTV